MPKHADDDAPAPPLKKPMPPLWKERPASGSLRSHLWIGILIGGLLAGAPWQATAQSPEPATAARPAQAEKPPTSLLLVTLDTTRADHIGVYHRLRSGLPEDPASGFQAPVTPRLDALAQRGTVYRRALTTSPLTLPAHASLLTGLDPPRHGLRDNGIRALSRELPTLATELARQGYRNAAFVGSRVLDRRFGLSHGFEVYDDTMPAEQLGEYGYPERDAAAVVDAALEWLGRQKTTDEAPPLFLWAHFYDPHAPYQPPRHLRRGTPVGDYAGEITHVDHHVGRLLDALPKGPEDWLVAVVGDHGEALGEHGERTHGLLLYRGALEIPLFLAGPGVPKGQTLEDPVSIRQVAPTLLHVLDIAASEDGSSLPRDGILPGFGEAGQRLDFVYSETWMPSTAYGWSPMVAITEGPWRLVIAPRPELFQYQDDPREANDRVRQDRRKARQLRQLWETWRQGHGPVAAAPLEVPADLSASLRSLGYLSGQSGEEDHAVWSGPEEGAIDPKDGLLMLNRLSRAKELLAVGNVTAGLPLLQELVAQSPDNVPFLTNLAGAQMAAGQTDDAIATLRRAVERNPHLDFLHLQLAEAHRHLEQWKEAEQEYRLVVDLNPRQASAWIGLAEILHKRGDNDGERRLLQEAVDAGTHSASIHLRLGQLESARQRHRAAQENLRQACRIAPTWPLPWLLLGQTLLGPEGDAAEAQEALRKVIQLAPRGAEAAQARRLLQGQ